MKRKTCLLPATAGMYLENIMLSEISETHKTNTQHDSTDMRGLEDSVVETERRVLVYRVQSSSFTR